MAKATVFKKKDKVVEYENSVFMTKRIRDSHAGAQKDQDMSPESAFEAMLGQCNAMNNEELVKENTQYRNTILMIHKQLMTVFEQINQNIVRLALPIFFLIKS